MVSQKRLVLGSILFALVGVGIVALSRSSGQPSATQPSLTISPQASELLNQVRDAYASLKSLGVSGKMAGHFEIDGMSNDKIGQFTGLYSSTGHFRSEMRETSGGDPATTQPSGDAVIGNTGEKVYVFLPTRNKYVMIDAPKGKVNLNSLGDDVADIIRNQDMSLALAISGDAAAELMIEATSIQRIPDIKIDGQEFPSVAIEHPQFDITLAFDPQTHLLRRATADLTKNAKLQGAREVKSAQLAMDFINTPAASVEDKLFAWSPPAGAQALAVSAGGASDLEGKPAPPFVLTDLNGNKVSSASLKGTVYVLDFWATWCAPCVAALPHLDAIYRDVKGSGVKFFAINQMEDKESVQKFVGDTKLEIPVLLDSDGKVSDVYDPEGIIPMTFVVGKDGKILKGGNLGGVEDQIRPIIQSANK